MGGDEEDKTQMRYATLPRGHQPDSGIDRSRLAVSLCDGSLGRPTVHGALKTIEK